MAFGMRCVECIEVMEFEEWNKHGSCGKMGRPDEIQDSVCLRCSQDNSFKYFCLLNCVLKVANISIGIP